MQAGAKAKSGEIWVSHTMVMQQSFQRIGVRKRWNRLHHQHLPESIGTNTFGSRSADPNRADHRNAESVGNKCLRLDGLPATQHS